MIATCMITLLTFSTIRDNRSNWMQWVAFYGILIVAGVDKYIMGT